MLWVCWSSVYVDDGVYRVSFLYVVVYLDGDGCHVGDRDLVHYCYVQVFFVVYRHVRFMFVFVSFQRVAGFVVLRGDIVVC